MVEEVNEVIELNVVPPNAKLINIGKLIEDKLSVSLSDKLSDCMYIIEHIGRICYNSYNPEHTAEDLIKFVGGAAMRGHRSIFEFGQLRFMGLFSGEECNHISDFLCTNKYVHYNYSTIANTNNVVLTITGSPRAFIEILENIMVYEGEGDLNKLFTYIYQSLYNTVYAIIANWETAEALDSYYESIYFLVKDIIHSKEYSIKDITREYSNPTDFTKFLFLVQCGRDVTHEIVRHRPCSYIQASQRYIRYNAKNPYLISLGTRLKEDIRNTVIASAKIAFDTYTELLKTNPPEDARLVLPNCTETKIFIYADRKEVRHFNRMRQSKFAYHPIKEVFDSIYFQMIDKKYL